MSLRELKLYFITYYRPLVYFEVFSIYLSVFHEFMWSPKPQKKHFFWIFEFFFPCFREGGGNYMDNSGSKKFTVSRKSFIKNGFEYYFFFFLHHVMHKFLRNRFFFIINYSLKATYKQTNEKKRSEKMRWWSFFLHHFLWKNV